MAVSFSSAVKAEICRSIGQNHCCALAAAYGVLLYCNSFGTDGIRVITESREFAMVLPKLFRKAFGVSFDQVPTAVSSGKMVFSVADPAKINKILECCGFDPERTLAMHLNLPLVEEECCKAAFLKGAFLAGGSVTDPAKGYHMEMGTTHQSVCAETYALIEEVMGFYPKTARRGGTRILYVKQSEFLSDFLTFLGAPVCAMEIMEARLEKDLNNRVNRRCNCDDANTSKVVEAAQEQLAAIRVLRNRGLLDKLPTKLLQAAKAREEHPEASLAELATLMSPPISKPAMNHRLKKLVELSKEELP